MAFALFWHVKTPSLSSEPKKEKKKKKKKKDRKKVKGKVLV